MADPQIAGRATDGNEFEARLADGSGGLREPAGSWEGPDSVRAEQISVLVISGICLYRDGLAGMLGQTGRIAVLGSAESVAQGVEICAGLPELPDVILLDTIPGDAELRIGSLERRPARCARAGADRAKSRERDRRDRRGWNRRVCDL